MHPVPSLASVCYALGYLSGLAGFLWMARRRGLATEAIGIIVASALVGGLVFANLSQWVVTGSGGKSILGGIAGGYLSVILAKKWIGLNRPLGDLFAVAICAGEAVGRWGCYFGGCCYGKPTHLPWAIWQNGALRHPTQIYLSLSCAAILFVLLQVEKLECEENMLFFVEGLLYCSARFFVEFLRDTPTTACGLSAAQWGCLVGILFFTCKITNSRTRGKASARTRFALDSPPQQPPIISSPIAGELTP